MVEEVVDVPEVFVDGFRQVVCVESIIKLRRKVFIRRGEYTVEDVFLCCR